MNVARGGTLIQHLPDDVGHNDHRRALGSFDNADHDVRLEPGSLAARACGETVHATKSHHHQAVDALGEGIVASRLERARRPGRGDRVARGAGRWACSGTPRSTRARGSCARSWTKPPASRRPRSGRRRGRVAHQPPIGRTRAARTGPVRAPRYIRGSVPRSTAIRAAACTVLAAGLAAPLLRRRLRLKPPVVIAAAAATPFALAVLIPRCARGTSGCARCRCTPTSATYQMPNDDPEKLERRVRVKYPVMADKPIGLGTTPTLRLQRALGTPGRFRRWEKPLVWSHWVWFAFPHGTVAYVLLKHRDQFPSAAARIYATFDIGVIGYWAIPTAPPWYAAAAGPDGGRPHAGAAPDDGRVRRAVLEAGLGASVRCPGRQSPGRHAVAAFRHLRDGRARAERHRSRRGRCSAGPTRPRSASRSSTSASTTSSTCWPGSRWPRASARATPTVSPLARGLGRPLQQLEAKARA